MKKLFVLAVVTLSSMAYAGGTPAPIVVPSGANSQQQQQQSTQQESTSQASNSGVSQDITFTSPENSRSTQDVHYSGSQTVRNVPSVSGPPLVSSNDTCMGSTSGSINVPGFGASLGNTWTDTNCKMLKNSRELWNMGMRAASLTLMCNDADNREALELTGYVCAQTERDRRAAVTSQSMGQHSQQPQYTDPIIRQRLGLAPLKGN